jgi:hypothetical protein
LVFSGSTEHSATVTIYYGSYTDTTTASALDGSWSITTSHALASGVYPVTVIVTDQAGNPSSSSSGKTVIIHSTCPN